MGMGNVGMVNVLEGSLSWEVVRSLAGAVVPTKCTSTSLTTLVVYRIVYLNKQ